MPEAAGLNKYGLTSDSDKAIMPEAAGLHH